MAIVDRLDEARVRLDVLKHPFYVRWMRGELSRDELRTYAQQYRHLVVGLADLSDSLTDSAPDAEVAMLGVHAAEERRHVEMWDRFADALDATREEPLAQTRDCVAAWTGAETFVEQLGVMYVIEASQPAISQTKLVGLAAHYEISEDAAAAEYFREHSVRDIAHSNQARALLRRHADEADAVSADAIVGAASAALEGNWEMLSGVQASV